MEYLHIRVDKPWYGYYPVKPNKKITVFRVTGLKILGRVGTFFLLFYHSGKIYNFMYFERRFAFQNA